MKTLGQKPTLAEALDYYDREDVRSFIYQACLDRKICMFFAAEMRWSKDWQRNFLSLESPEHLRDTIVRTFRDQMKGLAENEALDFYPSFHAAEDLLPDYKDFVLEADRKGWRKSFDDLHGALRILDEFSVTYRIKFSGHRSLHLMIPWEAFPERFGDISVRKEWTEVHRRIRSYFVLHGGLKAAHRPGGILRVAYSLNENTGLVSLPIRPEELEHFRPWEANIYQMKVDKPWFGDVPEDAKANTEGFLKEVFAETTDKKLSIPVTGVRIKPKDTSSYTTSPKHQIQNLRHGNASDRTQAAWNLMISDLDIPMNALTKGLKDEDATVRWFMAEALQRRVGEKAALELAMDLLLDEDEYVRVSATDFIIRACEAEPLTSVEILINSSADRDDVAYIVSKACFQNPETAEDIIQNLIHYMIKAEEMSILVHIFPLVKSFILSRPTKERSDQAAVPFFIHRARLNRRISVLTGMLLYLLRIMSQNKASRESMRVLEDFWPNNALTRRLPVKIASLLEVELPRTRPPRMAIDGVGDILETVDNTLEEMTETGRINVLVSMLLHGRKPTRIAAARVLKAVGNEAVPAIVAAIQFGSFDSIRLSAKEMAEVLKEIDPDPVGSLLKFLKSEDHRIQYGVLLLLRALGMRKAVKHLVEMLKNPSIRLRVFVVRSLGGIKGKKATEGLIAALQDRNRFVRMEAIKELKERMDSPGVRDAISERQQDRSKHVRKMAQEVINTAHS